MKKNISENRPMLLCKCVRMCWCGIAYFLLRIECITNGNIRLYISMWFNRLTSILILFARFHSAYKFLYSAAAHCAVSVWLARLCALLFLLSFDFFESNILFTTQTHIHTNTSSVDVFRLCVYVCYSCAIFCHDFNWISHWWAITTPNAISKPFTISTIDKIT